MAIYRPSLKMRLPIPDREKVDLGLPTCTLDVNQIAIRPAYHQRPELRGLACLEYNYFQLRSVELCVTPEAQAEISQGLASTSLGNAAYQRFKKTELFKARPASTVLDLSDHEADELWSDISESVWPGLSTGHLTRNQVGDVNQMFFHVVCSSMVANSAFVTLDGDFLRRASDLRARYGVAVLTPNDTWNRFAPSYGLTLPDEAEIDDL